MKAEYPVVGASPDGICKDFVVEVKCPTSEKAMSRYLTFANKITPKFFAQMQMHICNRPQALFCVANYDFEQSKSVHILTVTYDENYCIEMIEKCILFWCRFIFPLINKNYV